MNDRRTRRDHEVIRCALLGLLLAGATNVVLAVLESVLWAWWAAGACLLVALLVGRAWSGPDRERPARRRGGRTQQVQLLVGEVEPAALVRRDP